MKTLKKVGICGFCLLLLLISGYLFLFQNKYIVDNNSVFIVDAENEDDSLKYRYDTTNGYVGLDITLTDLKANDSSASVLASNTKKLQQAIDKVSDAGGGIVYLPSGTFYFGRGGYNSVKHGEDFVIRCRNNVHLRGSGTNENSSSYTVLKPVYNSPTASGGIDMFYFNNYKDTGFKQTNYNTSSVSDVSYVDADGKTVSLKNQTIYLVNADFSDFVIDGDSARGGIASAGGTYMSDGKGFMINLFTDCDWNNVVVKNVDATGFGVDCPINSTIRNCKAINCGKAALTTSPGASGFGIGFGYSNNESLVIDRCVSVNNKKFGFFFEHQSFFSDYHYKATASKGFVVSNSIAGGNMYDFGGLKANNVTYENNKSVSNLSTYAVSGLKATNTNGGTYKYTELKFNGNKVVLNKSVQPIYFSSYSTNSLVVNTDVYSMLTDVRLFGSEVKWAVNSGIIPVNSATKFGYNDAVNRITVVNSLYMFDGLNNTVSTLKNSTDINNYKKQISNIGYTDLGSYTSYLDSVIWAYNKGLVSRDTKFNPSRNCTRAEIAVMLYRLAGSPSVSGTLPFTDVKAGSWYYNAVLWCYQKGIIKGDSSSTFAANDVVSKAQLAIFLHRFKTAGAVSYKIKYNLMGGSASNASTYTSSSTFTLKNPTRSGFTFLGWTGSNGNKPSKSVKISKGTTGNLVYTANWSPNLTNIFVKKLPKQMVYKLDDNLNLSGLVIGGKYGDNNIKNITDYKVTPQTFSNTGAQVIEVSYNGLKTSFTVTVNEVAVKKLEIVDKPKKLTYCVGDKIDTAGLSLKVSYADGSTKVITSGFTVSPEILDSSGKKTITVSYGNESTTYTVEVEDISLSDIKIKSNPTRLNYFVGEYVDTTGLELVAIYNNGTTKNIIDGFSIDTNELLNPGKQKVTVTYKNKTTSFEIDVAEVKIVSIRVKELPKQIDYFVGDTFSNDGLKIAVLMNSFYEEEVDSGFSLSIDNGYKFTKSGVVPITVKYKDFSTSFNVNVYDFKNGALTISKRPDKTIFLAGDEFSVSGMVLEYVNSDGIRTSITDGYTLSFQVGGILENVGTHNITVIYNGKSVSYKIDVIKLAKLVVNDNSVKKTYNVGEKFDPTDMVVIAEYSNGIKEKLNKQYKIDVEGGNDFTSAGEKIVTVYYGNMESKFVISVEEALKEFNLLNLVLWIGIIILIIIFIVIIVIVIKKKFFTKKQLVPGRLFDENNSQY